MALTQLTPMRRAVRCPGRGRDEQRRLRDFVVSRRYLEMLWIGKKGPVKLGGVRGILRSRSKHAGIRLVHLHLLRHTFAVSCLRYGGDTPSLMRLLGHTSLAMTARYMSLTEVDLASKHRRHSPADLLDD